MDPGSHGNILGNASVVFDNITNSTAINNHHDGNPKYPLAMKIILNGVPIITVCTNFPSVILIFISLAKTRKLKNFHLLSLGITDLAVGLSSYLMVDVWYTTSTSHIPYYNCWLRYYVFSITLVSSMLHVLGICIQRVRSTFLHFNGHNQARVQWTIIMMSWLMSLILHTIPYVFWSNKYDLKECSIDFLFYGYEHEYMFYTGACFLIAEILVVTLMLVLLRILWINRRKFPDSSWSKKDVKLCTIVAVLAATFITCTLPLTIVLLCYDFLGIHKRVIRGICLLFALINSAINPVIYILKIQEFKDVVKGNRFCCKNNEISPCNHEMEEEITGQTGQNRNLSGHI